MNVALNMIIGQRHEQFLEYALKSTKWLDEHVIINTGQDDNPNMDIVKTILPGAKIIKMEGDFNFSKARNLALDNTSSPWVIWQDADEVHFDIFKNIVRRYSHTQHDGIMFGFHHFILDVFHIQSEDTRINMFKREGKRWEGAVHEKVTPFVNLCADNYRYHHYGYTKPQNEIYENWNLYWSLNPPERWKCDEKRNPNDIISDRATVARKYAGGYPSIMHNYIKQQTPKVKDYKLI